MSTQSSEYHVTGHARPGRPSAELEIQYREAENEALELRRARLSYREIARRQGVSDGTAWQRVQRALDRSPKEDAPSVRALELEGLDAQEADLLHRLDAPYWGRDDEGAPEIIYGKTPAEAASLHGTILKVRERRARLLGLDGPVSIDLRVDLTVEGRLAEAFGAYLTGVGDVIDGEVVPEIEGG